MFNSLKKLFVKCSLLKRQYTYQFQLLRDTLVESSTWSTWEKVTSKTLSFWLERLVPERNLMCLSVVQPFSKVFHAPLCCPFEVFDFAFGHSRWTQSISTSLARYSTSCSFFSKIFFFVCVLMYVIICQDVTITVNYLHPFLCILGCDL